MSLGFFFFFFRVRFFALVCLNIPLGVFTLFLLLVFVILFFLSEFILGR